MLDEEVQERPDARWHRPVVDEERVDRLAVARVELAQHLHEPSGRQILGDVEAGETRETHTRDRERAQRLAVAGRRAAGDRDAPRPPPDQERPALFCTAEVEAEAVVTAQVMWRAGGIRLSRYSGDVTTTRPLSKSLRALSELSASGPARTAISERSDSKSTTVSVSATSTCTSG